MLGFVLGAVVVAAAMGRDGEVAPDAAAPVTEAATSTEVAQAETAAEAEVTTPPEPEPREEMTLRGTGRQSTDPFSLPGGDYVASWDLTDDCFYGIDLEALDEDDETVVLGTSGPETASDNLYGIDGGRYYLDVNTGPQGSCAWTVTFAPR